MSLSLIPPNALVGLITFGRMVSVCTCIILSLTAYDSICLVIIIIAT